MSTVILCNGNYAKTPYSLPMDDIRLFSVEEICYYIYRNAFFLQEDFFCDELIAWIRTELGLPAYADALLALRSSDDSILKSIEYLFLATGYYGQEELQKVRSIMQEGSSLSVEERRKMRADAYCKRQKYKAALDEYADLLLNVPAEDVKFRAKLHHNMGVAYAGLFLYEQATQEFKNAFEIYPNTESYLQFLTAMKMYYSQTEYLSFLAEHPESYQDSLEVESRLQSAGQIWKDRIREDRISRITEEEGISAYEATRQILKQIKTEYTNMVGKG